MVIMLPWKRATPHPAPSCRQTFSNVHRMNCSVIQTVHPCDLRHLKGILFRYQQYQRRMKQVPLWVGQGGGLNMLFCSESAMPYPKTSFPPFLLSLFSSPESFLIISKAHREAGGHGQNQNFWRLIFIRVYFMSSTELSQHWTALPLGSEVLKKFIQATPARPAVAGLALLLGV